MRFPRKQPIALFVAALVAFVSCGDVHRVNVNPTTTSTVKEEVSVQPQKSVANELAAFRRVAANVKKVEDYKLFTDTGKVLDAARLLAEAERSATVSHGLRDRGKPSTTVATGSLASVMDCIRRHESGDYTEHSHISDGSGAYQMIPGTWAAWSERAGFSGYSYAYLAPPQVQDAVVVFTLTHGGAGNWSPRYGNDPCTVGMGG